MGVRFAIALAMLLAFPASAGAVKIGSDLSGTPQQNTGYYCGASDDCTVVQTTLPGDPYQTRVPFRGLIRSWRFRTVDPEFDPYRLRLWVVRKVAPERFRFVRRSKAGIVDDGPGTYVFRTRLRARKGDRIGIQMPGPLVGVMAWYVEHENALAYSWFPTPSAGTTVPADPPDSGTEYFYNATVRRKR